MGSHLEIVAYSTAGFGALAFFSLVDFFILVVFL